MNTTDKERAKYREAWSIPAYANSSPGEKFADLFMEVANPATTDTVLDVGAGSGKGSRALKDKGLSVTAFDLVDEAWDHDDIHLITGSLWKPLPVAGAYRFGYCCDVMEHIPTEFTALVVDRILTKCGSAFFSICFEPDNFGALLGQPLHLTVKPFKWWLNLMEELAMVHEARDLMGEGIFYVSRLRGIA